MIRSLAGLLHLFLQDQLSFIGLSHAALAVGPLLIVQALPGLAMMLSTLISGVNGELILENAGGFGVLLPIFDCYLW